MPSMLTRRGLLGLSSLLSAAPTLAAPARPDLRGNRITWLGFSTVRVDTADGRTILVDPWLEFPGCPLAVAQVERLDAILVTHGHWQHVGQCVALHEKTGAPVIAVEEVSAWLKSRGVGTAPRVNVGGTVEVAGIKVSLTPAVHSSGILEKDGNWLSYGGDPAGFVMHLPGGVRVYHAGDTDVFGDMALIRQRWAPQVGLLPVGDVTTMGPDGAALATELLGLGAVIPMHYDLPGFTGTPAAFERALSDRRSKAMVVHARRGEVLA